MKVINGSPNISQLDFNILLDLSGVDPDILLTNNSVYPTGSNRDGCIWWYVIQTPSATIIHQGTEASPDMSGDWATEDVDCSSWVQPFNQVEWSGTDYKATLYIKDSEGNIFYEEKSIKLCRPNGLTKDAVGNYGVADATVDTKCDTAKLLVTDTTNYNYNNHAGSSVSKQFVLNYPLDDDGTRLDAVTANDIDTPLFAIPVNGKGYVLVVNNVQRYDFNNNVSVQIKYKKMLDFAVYCNIDFCPLMCEYYNLIEDVKNGKCGDPKSPENQEKLTVLSSMISGAIIAYLQPHCAVKPVPELIEEIKAYAGFDCDCYRKGNVPKNTGSELNLNFDTDCGDIEAEVEGSGYNFTVTLKNRVTVINFAQDALDAGFSIEEDTDEDCKRKFTISFDSSQFPTACCPIRIPIFDRDKDPEAAPDDCPGNFYDAKVYNVANDTSLGLSNDPNHTVSILNADAGWSALGVWMNGGNCHVYVIPVDPNAIDENLFIPVEIIDDGCIDGNKVFSNNFIDYCEGSNQQQVNFPAKLYISYDSGANVYPLGKCADYNDFITKAAAETNNPGNITVQANADQNLYDVQIYQLDCLQTNTVRIYIDQDGYLAVTSNHHSSVPTAGGGVYGVHMDTEQSLGRVCGQPADTYMWHVRKIGQFIYTVESDTGLVKKFDFSDPLNPVFVRSVQLPPNGNGTIVPFSGIPQKAGLPTHFDCYMVTDYDPNPLFLYIVESTSGVIWKYDILSDSVVAHFFAEELVGRCPRLIRENTLWLSMDGNLRSLTGLSNPVNDEDIVLLNLNNFSPLSFSTLATGVSSDSLYALSYDAEDDLVYGTFYSGTVVKINASSLVVDNTYSGVFAPATGMGQYCNTRVIREDADNKYLYASTLGAGSYRVDLPAVNNRLIFDNNMIDGNGDPFSNNNHYNVVPVPGRCYLLLTFDNGALPGGVAKFTYDGKFIALTPIQVGDVYNVELFSNVNKTTPNSYC